MTRTILVPLNVTSSAESVLPAAAALADALNARLLLVRPVSARSPESGDSSGACRVARAHVVLQECAARARAHNPFLRVGVSAPIGPWPDAVLDEAALERAELVVVDRRLTGNGAAAPAGAGLLGAGAIALSRRADVPVLLLSPGGGELAGAVESDAPLRVLVPLDGSPTGEAILPVLVRLAASVPLRVTVLHVLPLAGDPGSAPLPGASLAVAALGTARMTRRHVSWTTAASYCRRVADWLERYGVPAHVELRTGDAVEEIGRAALDLALHRGGLLALGLPEALPWRFGYSAERIMRAAPVPVLQLRSARSEHVVPLEEAPAESVVGGVTEAERSAGSLLAATGERDHPAHGGAPAGGRL